MDFNNDLISAFQHAIGPGRDAVGGAAFSLLSLLVALDLTLAAIFWAIAGENFIPRFLKKILIIGLFSWFVKDYEKIMSYIMDGFIETAHLATGRDVAGLIKDPAGIMDEGLRVIKPIINYLGGRGILDLGGDMLFAVLTLFIALVAFTVLAITVTVTWIEYFLLTTLALILIPFGVFKHTAFLAERAFALAISFGVKIMVMATVIGIAAPLLFNLTVPDTPSFWDMSFVMLASLTVSVLAVHAPGLAAGILAGSPSLSAASAFSGVAGAAGAASLSGGALRAGVGAALSGAGVAASGAGRVAGGVAAAKDEFQRRGGGAQGMLAGAALATGRGALQGGDRILSKVAGSEAGIRNELRERFSRGKESMQIPGGLPGSSQRKRAGKGGANSLGKFAGSLRSSAPEGGLSVPIKEGEE